MSQKPMKPHLVEINTLKGLLSQISEWINLYKKLIETETIYSNLYNNIEEKEMKKYYKKRMIQTSKRLDILGKRLNIDKLTILYDKITSRIQILYQFDRQMLQEENFHENN